MSSHGTLRRYSLILEKVRGDHFPTLLAIKEFLGRHSFEISARTLQRDIQHLKEEFGLEIEFNHAENGYCLAETSGQYIEAFLRFIEITALGRLLFESLTEGKQSLRHVSFGTPGTLKGIELIKPILKAIDTHQTLSFFYKPFECETAKQRQVNPYLLREYLGRWYLVGTFSGHGKLYSFGLDRISDLQILDQHFRPHPHLDPAAVFAKTIGVSNPHEKPETVRLAFTPAQAKYLKTLPMHPSQRVISEDEKECIMELRVIPNFELYQRILMHGSEVRVIEPSSLVEEIKNAHHTAWKRYQPDSVGEG